MSTIRTLAKNLAADLLYRSGILGFMIRRKFRNRALILTYHRVLPPSIRCMSFSHDAIIVSPDTFDNHLKTLIRYFDIVDMVEFARRIGSQNISGRGQCLITFDDAWQDNRHHALDILARHRLPATVFVPTDYIAGGKVFWQEHLGHCLNKICELNSETAAAILRKHGLDYLTKAPAEVRHAEIIDAVRSIKNRGYAEIAATIDEFETCLGGPIEDFGVDSYLTEEHIQEMAESLVLFQSHGCSHRILTRISSDELRRELSESADWIGTHLGYPAYVIAYPNGDHDATVARIAQETGYRLGFTTESGYVDGTSNPMMLKRVNMNDATAGSSARLLLTIYLAC